MQIELSKIKSAPKPIRSTQDPEKLEELTTSIGEYGLLQAIKVRPVGDTFEVVFGHRRVEASRRMGLKYIEAVVEDLNDSTAMIHALIENAVREDLGSLDKARALKALQDETGWNAVHIASQGFMGAEHVRRLLALLEEPEEVQQLMAEPSQKRARGPFSKPITERHIRAVRRIDLPKEQHIQVLQKAAKEGLTAREAEVEARILKTFGTEEEIEAQSVRYEQSLIEDKERSRWNYLAQSPCAKNFLRHIKINKHGLKRLWEDVDRGALGVEHMPYVEDQLRKYAEFILSLADDLDTRRREAVSG